MFKTIKRKHLLLLSLAIVTAAILSLTTKGSAFFTSKSEMSTSGKVAKLNIVESKPLQLSNKNLFNPGDYDLEKDENARPGTDHDLTFSLKNQGDIGALTRNIITLSVNPDSNLDASNFYLVEPGSEGDGVAQGQLVKTHKVFYSEDYEPNKNSTFTDTKEELNHVRAVRYIIEGDVLSPDNIEDETAMSEKNYAYGVALSKDAGNDYANSGLNVEVKVQAVQDSNVSGDLLDPNSPEWSVIFTGKQ